jgi:aminoglycoside phosphotransferase (APT) family kinase protein
LCHGDYRLDNLLFAPPTRPDDPVVAIDWGVVSVGVPQRDVALLVAAGLDPDERRNGERAVLGAYHRRLVELGVTDYDADANWDDYRHSLLYPLMVVVLGWAHSQRSERGDDMFQVMAARSASAIADHDPFSVL